MSDSITLPRSGVVLRSEPNAAGEERLFFDRPDQEIVYYIAEARAGEEPHYMAHFTREDMWGTRDDCIAWLDSRVLALRAALMPADAREVIAAALDESFNKVMSGPSCECEDDERRPYDALCVPCKAGPRYMADAVLAALGAPSAPGDGGGT